MDHEEESEMAETTRNEVTTGKHRVDRRVEEPQTYDECAIEM